MSGHKMDVFERDARKYTGYAGSESVPSAERAYFFKMAHRAADQFEAREAVKAKSKRKWIRREDNSEDYRDYKREPRVDISEFENGRPAGQ